MSTGKTVWLVWLFLKVKYRITVRPSNLTPREIKTLSSHENLHVNIHGSIIRNSQNVKITQMPFKWWTDKSNISRQWNIIQPKKGMKFWIMLQHGWYLKTSCQKEDASHQSSCIVCLYIYVCVCVCVCVCVYIYETSRIGKFIKTESRFSVCTGLRLEV